MIKDASHENVSCWTVPYSLRNCEGYQAYEAGKWLGYVDAVLVDGQDDVHSLLVRAGDFFIAVPLEAVVSIDAAAERIDLADRRDARALRTREAWV
jgi:hypothetical protein